jgi:hypothetical protein
LLGLGLTDRCQHGGSGGNSAQICGDFLHLEQLLQWTA